MSAAIKARVLSLHRSCLDFAVRLLGLPQEQHPKGLEFGK
jgi:hypothetical protein